MQPITALCKLQNFAALVPVQTQFLSEDLALRSCAMKAAWLQKKSNISKLNFCPTSLLSIIGGLGTWSDLEFGCSAVQVGFSIGSSELWSWCISSHRCYLCCWGWGNPRSSFARGTTLQEPQFGISSFSKEDFSTVKQLWQVCRKAFGSPSLARGPVCTYEDSSVSWQLRDISRLLR